LPTVMADIESLLNRWQTAGVLDVETAGRIRAHEAAQKKPGVALAGNRRADSWAILLACGWCSSSRLTGPDWPRRAACCGAGDGERLSPGRRLARERFHGLSTALHAVGTISTARPSRWSGRSSTFRSIGRRRCSCGHWPRWPVGRCSTMRRNRRWRCCSFQRGFFRSFVCREGRIGGSVYLGRILLPGRSLPHLLSRLEAQGSSGILFAVAMIAAGVGLPSVGRLYSWAAKLFVLGLRTWAG